MSMKVMVRETEGYSEEMLESMLHRTLFPSSFSLVQARGVCFVAGHNSSELARNFAEKYLDLGVISICPEASAAPSWREISRVFAHPQTTASRVGILLPHLDKTSAETQAQICHSILATNNLLWFPSANDFRKLIQPLKLAFVVYLGLGKTNQMQVLIQSGQKIEIDEGSLKRAPRPNLN